MDSLAHCRRLGLPQGSKIPDELLVTSAGPNDPHSAQYILQLCYQRLAQVASTEEQTRLLDFLNLLAFAELPAYDLDDRTLPMAITEIDKAVKRNRGVFGDVFTNHLISRLKVLRSPTAPPVSAAFNLRLAYGEGRSTEFERDFETAEGVENILRDLKRGRLRNQALLVLADSSKKLFSSIEKHLRVTGYRYCDIDSYRLRLATQIDELTSQYGKNAETAARIFIECMKARRALLLEILGNGTVDPAEKIHLEKQVGALNSYGAASRGKGQKGVGLSGIRSIHKRLKSDLPPQFTGSSTSRNRDKSAVLLAENHRAVRKALDIINSPDVGNHSIKDLQKLQKQTAKEHQHIWPDLWDQFAANALTREQSSEAKP